MIFFDADAHFKMWSFEEMSSVFWHCPAIPNSWVVDQGKSGVLLKVVEVFGVGHVAHFTRKSEVLRGSFDSKFSES